MSYLDPKTMSIQQKCDIMRKFCKHAKHESTEEIVARACRKIMQQKVCDPGYCWLGTVRMMSDPVRFVWLGMDIEKVRTDDDTVLDVARKSARDGSRKSMEDMLRPESFNNDEVTAIFIGIGGSYAVFGVNIDSDDSLRIVRVDDEIEEVRSQDGNDMHTRLTKEAFAARFDEEMEAGNIPMSFLEEPSDDGFQQFMQRLGLCPGSCDCCDDDDDDDDSTEETDVPEADQHACECGDGCKCTEGQCECGKSPDGENNDPDDWEE